jgi:hypothetical protein
MQDWHGPDGYGAQEPITHDKLISRPQLFDKRHEFRKIVTVVRIADDNVPPLRAAYARLQRRTITFDGNTDYPRAHPLRDSLRTVCAAIIGNNNLSRYIRILQKARRFVDAAFERFSFIETRHHDA